jgi:hypothetical protein
MTNEEIKTENEKLIQQITKSGMIESAQIIGIIAITQEGKTVILQTPGISVKQFADRLFKIANQIMGSLNNKNNSKPN